MVCFSKEKNAIDVIRDKIKRNAHLVTVTMLIAEHRVCIYGADEALTAAFLYSIYRYAKEKGLEPELYHMMPIKESEIPDEVKKIGEEWTRRRLRKEEIEKLKLKFLTSVLVSR